MAVINMQAKAKEFVFTKDDFDRLRNLVGEHTGISLSDAKQQLIYGRLTRRLRTLGLQNFSQYCDLLESDPGEEFEDFVNAITTNLTSFFRESHHFDFLRETALPEVIARNRGSGRVRLWSAGCSSGEEPYSIAITAVEVLARSPNCDLKILATDLDSNMVATGAQGVYRSERVEGLEGSCLRRWFRKGRGQSVGQVRVNPELQQLLSFRQLNLMTAWPMHGPLDIIFCRNVVIYFDKDTQRKLFARFAKLQPPGSYLFIGHSETLAGVTDKYRLLHQTIYQRVD